MTKDELGPALRGGSGETQPSAVEAVRHNIRISILALASTLLAAGGVRALELSELRLETVATGLDRVIALTHAGDERLFVTLQTGRVLVLVDGEIQPEPFLDIFDRVSHNHDAEGLFSIAFHPGYAENGFLFVNYVDPVGDSITARFQRSEEDPGRVDPSTEKIVLRVDKAQGFHYGGQLQFGPDGYLYISSGDSGAGDPMCLAQDGDSLEGKLLRIDVDQNVDVPPYHGIPADNPFVGVAGVRDEIWATGLRNPWRFSFDRETGDLYIADVGQDDREEVDFQPAGNPGGQNYGWKRMEGTLCRTDVGGCSPPPPECDDPSYTPPVLEYGHDAGCAIIGGYVVRGQELDDLAGNYFYGDTCRGTLWAAERTGLVWESQELAVTLPGVVTFGEDAQGELYLATRDTLVKLVAAELPPPPPPPPNCVPGATSLCLDEGRFRVEIGWTQDDGTSGSGHAVPLTDDAGYFWFFGEGNPEIFVKVLNACADPFNHYWVFVAGLTNVETRLVVTDTVAGVTRRYDKPQSVAFAPIQDTTAFATCP